MEKLAEGKGGMGHAFYSRLDIYRTFLDKEPMLATNAIPLTAPTNSVKIPSPLHLQT